MPELADAPLQQLKPIVRRWHQRALEHIGTKPFEDTWFDFAEGWSKVKYAKGKGPMAMIFAKAIDADVPDVARQYEQPEQPELQLLVALCRKLQRACGDDSFFLATRTAGGLVGVDHSTASRWLRGLCIDGILKLVAKGNRTTRKANRLRYLQTM